MSSEQTSAELRRIITQVEIGHRKHQVLALPTGQEEQSSEIHDVAGSVTIISDPKYGRKLNHTQGFGMFGPVTMEDLLAIELVYERCSPAGETCLQPDLDVCEYADGTAFGLLSVNYSVTGSVCQHQCYLARFESPPALIPDIEASSALSCSREAFIEASIDGFRSGGRDVSILRALAHSATARSDTMLFSATSNNELVGTAAMAVIDVDDCKVALLFMDSCLEHARGKGVHKAMLLERMRVAKDIGCEMAIAAAREGSGSARNIQRAGLSKIFMCKTYARKLVGKAE